jgi:LmbE family N-acetylglucosaminyl deacetylase
MPEGSAIAIAAHPDDIEFMMAGTLCLLRRAGFKVHYLTLANGSCGSAEIPAAKLKQIRERESRRAASALGATFHRSYVDDLEIIYGIPLLRALAAKIREVRPSIVLTHSPQDYMEDHVQTCRLAVTAAFARGMPNFITRPRRATWAGDTTVYHAMPHGLRDGMRQKVQPGLFVDVGSVRETKLAALACHASQQRWLRATQGMNSYVKASDDMAREVGRMSHKFKYAEGWRQHSHLGFSATDHNPLAAALGKKYMVVRGSSRAAE